jgi:hypothetical protein
MKSLPCVITGATVITIACLVLVVALMEIVR